MKVPPYMVDTNIYQRLNTSYYQRSVVMIDTAFGDGRTQEAVLENTVIIIAADNGKTPGSTDKSRLNDSGIKTPRIIHYPKIIKQATVS